MLSCFGHYNRSSYLLTYYVCIITVIVSITVTAAVDAMRKAGCCARTMYRVTGAGERPGALWHIYNPRDADKIRQLLTQVIIVILILINL